MSGSSLTVDAMLACAEKKKQTVRYPAENELFLDIDTDEDYKILIHNADVLGNLVSGILTTISKSGLPHRHVVVTLSTHVTQLERILLQACLGSDRKHELLSYLAALDGNAQPTVFFE